MTDFVLTLDWDDEGVQQLCKAAIRRISDMTPVMADFAEHMIHETMERFEQEEDPEGNGWQKLNKVYEEVKAEAGKTSKILHWDGGLKSSLQEDYDESGGGVSAHKEYAAIHNFGGTIKPKKGKALKFNNRIVSQVKIPKRQFLGFNDDDIDYFNESVTGWVVMAEVGS